MLVPLNSGNKRAGKKGYNKNNKLGDLAVEMGVPKSSPPECFGDLERVFPPGDGGLRKSPDSCMACGHKTACLQKALVNGGAARIRFERTERKEDNSGFLRRWSARKHYFRSLEKGKKRQ